MVEYPDVCLQVSLENRSIFVNANEIIYALAEGNYTIFHLTNQRTVKVLRKLKQVDQLLTNKNFIRIHRSYLINLGHLRRCTSTLVEMSNAQQLPISRTWRSQFQQKFIRL